MNTKNGSNIHVSIRGRIAQKTRIKDYIVETIQHMMPRLRRDVTVDIQIVNTCEHEFYGLCWGDRSGSEIELPRNAYGVPFSLDEMMRNLAHELVHTKQLLRGELSRNQWWKNDQSYSNTIYGKQPWEKEAYILEDTIYQKYWL